jgi:hypothetical protein
MLFDREEAIRELERFLERAAGTHAS